MRFLPLFLLLTPCAVQVSSPQVFAQYCMPTQIAGPIVNIVQTTVPGAVTQDVQESFTFIIACNANGGAQCQVRIFQTLNRAFNKFLNARSYDESWTSYYDCGSINQVFQQNTDWGQQYSGNYQLLYSVVDYSAYPYVSVKSGTITFPVQSYYN